MFKIPAIPDPGASLASIADTVRGLKAAVEVLTGQTGQPGDKAAHLYVQGTQPTTAHSGCIWVDTANANKLRVWDGTQWINVTV